MDIPHGTRVSVKMLLSILKVLCSMYLLNCVRCLPLVLKDMSWSTRREFHLALSQSFEGVLQY